ncbi:MAG: hypothetical protein HXS44_06605 [Theionarchaea archaeon]|nr:hypothetical protein [Theionarchaea archaeon]
MKEYFNLNDRARKAWNNNGGKVCDKGLPVFSTESENHQEENSLEVLGKITLVNQILMYVGTFMGVLLSTAVTHFKMGNPDLTITVGEVVLSAVVAFIIIPLVYEKLMLNPKAPFIVQFGLFVQNGVFWHILIDSIGSTL